MTPAANRWLIPVTLAVGLLIGFSIGGKTRFGGDKTTSATIPERTSPRSKPRERDESLSERSRIRALLSDSGSTREDNLGKIESADIPLILSVLSEKGGIKGVDYSERDPMQELIGRWYGEDPASAIAWISRITNPGDRQFYLESIAGILASKDILEAVSFMETHLTGSILPIDVPYGFLNAAAKEGPELLLRALISTFDTSKSSSGGWSRIEVPDGFNHKAFMDALSATNLPDEPGRTMQGVPEMMIRKWAEIDPNATYEWLLASQESGASEKFFHDGGISDFFEGYAETTEPEEYGKFTASVFSSKQGEPAYRAAWDALTSKPDEKTIATFLETASPDGSRNQVLSGMLDISQNYSGGDYDKMRTRLFGMLTEKEQITYFRKAPQGVSEALTPILRRQGYTPEQIKGLKNPKAE
jgi:hypothetical protein